MKWSLIALATLSAAAGSASAQSSVTLSGSVDAGIRRVGAATGSDWQMGGSGSSFNRFILAGREDLGGGMSAIFSLQHRFNVQNGTIGGTPTTAGVFSVPISGTSPGGTANAVLTITIAAAQPLPVINSSIAASGVVGTSFSYSVSALNS